MLQAQHLCYNTPEGAAEKDVAMTLHPLSLVPQSHTPEVPGLAYYSSQTAAALPPRIAQTATPSRSAEALAQMYGYYTPAD